MAAPSKVCVVITCENEITRDGIAFACGNWMVVTRGDELPYCYRCKRPQRCWRLVTEQEIAARDRAFERRLEQVAPLDERS